MKQRSDLSQRAKEKPNQLLKVPQGDRGGRQPGGFDVPARRKRRVGSLTCVWSHYIRTKDGVKDGAHLFDLSEEKLDAAAQKNPKMQT